MEFVFPVAVIRNMAFETLAFRKEIRIFKGIEAMVKVSELALVLGILRFDKVCFCCGW